MSLITIEVCGPGQRYTLFETGPDLTVHLAGPGASGGIGPCICGFDRHARGADGRSLYGFSVGGGVTPATTHKRCPDCARLVDGQSINGVHAGLFAVAPTGDGESNG